MKLPSSKLVAGLAGGLCIGVTLAIAQLNVPNQFAPETPLSAQQMNANFTAVASEFNAMRATLDELAQQVERQAETISALEAGPSVCGATQSQTGALRFNGLTGNAAANAMCQTACGNDERAHVCTLHEAAILVERQVGLPEAVPVSEACGGRCARTSAGREISPSVNGQTKRYSNCRNWTADEVGSIDESHVLKHIEQGAVPSNLHCSEPAPLLCCR